MSDPRSNGKRSLASSDSRPLPASAGPACSPARIRVLLVGNQPMVRGGLAQFIAKHEGLAVVTEATLADALSAATEHQPDVLVLIAGDDVRRTRELLPALLRASLQTAILLVTRESDPYADARVIALGVRGLLMLEQPPAILLEAIEKVHAGELWFDRTRTARLAHHIASARGSPEHSNIASLTRRELEIVRLIGEGLRSAQIAERLFISQATVRNHLTSILGKLDLTDSFDLAVYAYRHGLVRFRDAIREDDP